MDSQPLRLVVNSPDAAKALCISERHLWQLEHIGALNAIKFGRSKRYAVRELERFVADRQSRAAATDELVKPIYAQTT